MADKRVTVKEFADYFQFEQLTGDEQSLKRGIELTDTNRPGLELAGSWVTRKLRISPR